MYIIYVDENNDLYTTYLTFLLSNAKMHQYLQPHELFEKRWGRSNGWDNEI